MEEIWKDIEGYEGLYQVSNLGQVKTLDKIISSGLHIKEKYLSFFKTKNGYFQVTLRKNGSKRNFYVHRLVASAFIANPNNLSQVGHKDETTINNRADNLEWVTAKENSNMPQHKTRLSVSNSGNKLSLQTKQKMSNSKRRGKHNMAKKTECDGKIFACIEDCAEYYKVKYTTMCQWLNGTNPMPLEWKNRGLKYV